MENNGIKSMNIPDEVFKSIKAPAGHEYEGKTLLDVINKAEVPSLKEEILYSFKRELLN